MKRKHRLFAVVTALMMSLALVLNGCGSTSGKKRDTEKPKTPAATSEPKKTDPKDGGVPENGCAISFPDGKRYHYDMDLRLDPEARTVGGHVAFRFFNDSEDGWDRLCMRDYPSLFANGTDAGYRAGRVTDGAMTEITGVTDSRGGEIRIQRDKDVSVLWLPLSEPLEPGEEMTLEYDFTATIPTLDDRFGVANGIFCATNFYPILAEYVDGGWSHEAFINIGECFYSEIADYDVKLTVPDGFAALATGTEAGSDSRDGFTTCTFTAPCVRDFVFTASDRFAVEDAAYNGVHVNVAYNAENPPASDMEPFVDAALATAEQSLAAFGDAFGMYPYDELDIVFTPMSDDAGGMEYPNLILIAEACCREEEGEDASSISLDDLQTCVAHEIGHQWFMGIVGSNSATEPWLDESITSYTELVYLEYGDDSSALRRAARYHSSSNVDLTDPDIAAQLRKEDIFPINRAYSEFSDYVIPIYGVGDIVLYQMEEILGREEFHAILREYVHRNAFTNADTQDFFDVLYDVAGRDNEELNTLIAHAFDL